MKLTKLKQQKPRRHQYALARHQSSCRFCQSTASAKDGRIALFRASRPLVLISTGSIVIFIMLIIFLYFIRFSPDGTKYRSHLEAMMVRGFVM